MNDNKDLPPEVRALAFAYDMLYRALTRFDWYEVTWRSKTAGVTIERVSRVRAHGPADAMSRVMLTHEEKPYFEIIGEPRLCKEEA